MKCKYASKRSAYTGSIPRMTDEGLVKSIQEQKASFAEGHHIGKHHMQVWRQTYLAEARKRGLET